LADFEVHWTTSGRAYIVTRKLATGAAFLLLAVVSAAQDPGLKNVRVPDAATALSIAQPALVKLYGKRQIEYEKPLAAKLESGIWSVYATLCCPDRKGQRICGEGQCLGGVAILKLRQIDGKILSISHGK
jgi:hypothetical protein